MSSLLRDPLHSSASAFEVRHQSHSGQEREAAEGSSKDAEAKAEAKIGFTRRCGTRAPADGRPCMHTFGHDGPHAWESEDTRT
jgi:hypothetical protein